MARRPHRRDHPARQPHRPGRTHDPDVRRRGPRGTEPAGTTSPPPWAPAPSKPNSATAPTRPSPTADGPTTTTSNQAKPNQHRVTNQPIEGSKFRCRQRVRIQMPLTSAALFVDGLLA